MSKLNIRVALPLDAATITELQVQSWRSTYRAIIPAGYLARLSLQERTREWREILQGPENAVTQITYIAENAAGEIIGFISGGANREAEYSFDAEIYSLYLWSAYQKQGIGSKLVHTLENWFLQQNMQSMLVWVLEKNPACGFYAAMGGTLLTYKKPMNFDEVTLVQVAYGWHGCG